MYIRNCLPLYPPPCLLAMRIINLMMCMYLMFFSYLCINSCRVTSKMLLSGIVRACTDGAANILYDCRSNDMLLPTLISGDFDSLRCDALNYYDNIVKVSHLWLKAKVRFPLPELTARVDGWPVSITRQYGCAFPLAELTGCQHGPSTRLLETRARRHGLCWRVIETGHPSTWAVNLGSGNRTLKFTSFLLDSYPSRQFPMQALEWICGFC